MYELEQAGTGSYYVNCPAKIGIYVGEQKDAYLIDSGNDKEVRRKRLSFVIYVADEARKIMK